MENEIDYDHAEVVYIKFINNEDIIAVLQSVDSKNYFITLPYKIQLYPSPRGTFTPYLVSWIPLQEIAKKTLMIPRKRVLIQHKVDTETRERYLSALQNKEQRQYENYASDYGYYEDADADNADSDYDTMSEIIDKRKLH